MMIKYGMPVFWVPLLIPRNCHIRHKTEMFKNSIWLIREQRKEYKKNIPKSGQPFIL